MKEALKKKFSNNSRPVKGRSHSRFVEANDANSNNVFPNSNNTKLRSSSRSKGPSKWTQEDLASALMMVRDGTPIKPAAERFNIPVMTLWRRTRALGLVSSKVQCGFRYSTSRGNFNSLHSFSFHSKTVKPDSRQPKRNFFKERSPLTESNCKICQTSDEVAVSKNKAQETSHKENSLGATSNADLHHGLPSSQNSTAMIGDHGGVISDFDSGMPSKEFLVWLNCLRYKTGDNHFINKEMPLGNSLKFKT